MPNERPVDALRVNVGDTACDMEVLKDTEYEYFLTKYGSINRATIPAMTAVMFALSRWTHERLGQIEVYGGEWATNYRKALELAIKNPEMSIASLMPYGGGISKSDMRANVCNADTNAVTLPARTCCTASVCNCSNRYF